MSNLAMSISDMQDVISNYDPLDKTILMYGAPGVGKTSIIDAVLNDPASRYEHLITLRPSQLEPSDFALPVYDRDTKSVDMVSNSILPTLKNTILFVDEFGQGGRSIQKPLMQLLNAGERGLGNHYRLPDDCLTIAATNRIEDRSGVEKMLAAMSERFCHIDVQPDMKKWCVWAIQNDIPTEIVAYVRFNPSAFDDFDFTRRTNPNPRNWVFAGRAIRKGYSQRVLEVMLSGIIGEEQATNLIAFLNIWGTLPSLDEIARNPLTAPLPDGDGSAGTHYAIAGAIANAANRDNFGTFVQYLNRLSKEFEVFSVQTMTDKHRGNGEYEKFVTNKSYVNWCVENQDVIL